MTAQCKAETANQQQHQQNCRDKFMNVSHSWQCLPCNSHSSSHWMQTSIWIFFFFSAYRVSRVCVCLNCFPIRIAAKKTCAFAQTAKNKQKSIFKIHDTGWHSEISKSLFAVCSSPLKIREWNLNGNSVSVKWKQTSKPAIWSAWLIKQKKSSTRSSRAANRCTQFVDNSVYLAFKSKWSGKKSERKQETGRRRLKELP